MCKGVDDALALDTRLARSMEGQKQHRQQQQQQQQDTCLDEVSCNSRLSSSSSHGRTSSSSVSHSIHTSDQQQDSLQADAQKAAEQVAPVDDATDLQPLAERLQEQVELMYFQWRSALDARAVALTENFRLGDELRAAREETHEKDHKLQGLQKSHQSLELQLNHSQVRQGCARVLGLTSRLIWPTW